MKLGVHAMAWPNALQDPSFPFLDEAKRLGLDFIEIGLSDPEELPVGPLGRKLQSSGLDVVISTLLTDARHDLTSPDSSTRAAGVEYLKLCVRRASELGASLFTGVVYSLHMKRHQGRPGEDSWQYAAEGLRQVARYAGELGVDVGIEPINRYETFLINTCEQALALVELIGEANAGIHLDTYHMNVEEKSLPEAVRRAGTRLKHIHLNENDWGIPGTGHIPWDNLFGTLKEINYQGYASLECVVDFQGNFVWRQLADSNRALVEEGVRYLQLKRKQHGLD